MTPEEYERKLKKQKMLIRDLMDALENTSYALGWHLSGSQPGARTVHRMQEENHILMEHVRKELE